MSNIGKDWNFEREIYGMGWLPDLPDFRDFKFSERPVKEIFKASIEPSEFPKTVDLREGCSPIEDQGSLGSCTAQAVVGLVEYIERQFKNEFLNGSRRFLYKVTRRLLGLHGDSGASVRGTIKSLRIFGVCPEDFWKYDISNFDEEPPAFCYAFAQAYQAIEYYRLTDIEELKYCLSKGYPFAFGFAVFDSIYDPAVRETGDIPFPKSNDRLVGGHAVVAVGFDEKRNVFYIRNSWGTGWGNQGYGTLPYAYIERGLALDFWVLVNLKYEGLSGL